MDELELGLVKIISGKHKGRVGLYDDETLDGKSGVIYFGDPILNQSSYDIPKRSLSSATTDDLFTRSNELFHIVNADKKLKKSHAFKLLSEYYFINHQLQERLVEAKLYPNLNSKKIFLSHSSKDKQFVRWLNIDLRNKGHNTWMDEWEIKVGDSIPKRLSHGIEECDFVIVVLTKEAVKSRWVENEWQAKYWDEVSEGKVKVLPLLLEECKIPTFLKIKKYADFTQGYSEGFDELLLSLNGN